MKRILNYSGKISNDNVRETSATTDEQYNEVKMITCDSKRNIPGNFRKSRQNLGFLACLFCFIIINAATVYGAEVRWQNPGNGNWNTASAWNTGSVPTAEDDVFIDVDGTYTVTINSAVTAHSITIGAGAGTQNVLLDNGTINADVINKGVIRSRRTSTFNGVLENQATGELIVEGTYLFNATTTVANGFENYGRIDLTNNNRTYQATLAVNNGALINHGTIRSLYGAGGGNRYLTAALDNRGTLQLDHQLEINKPEGAIHINSGTINVTGGDLTLTQSGSGAKLTNAGEIAVASGKKIEVNGGSFVPSTGTLNGQMYIISGSSSRKARCGAR